MEGVQVRGSIKSGKSYEGLIDFGIDPHEIAP